MSLSVAGVWQVGVWDETVWADGVWREGAFATREPFDRVRASVFITRGASASVNITTDVETGVVSITTKADIGVEG